MTTASRRTLWLVLAAGLFLAGCGKPTEAESLLWVGHIAPLSGPHRQRGEDAVRAMQLLMEQLKEIGKTFDGRTLGVRHIDAREKRTVRAEAVRLLSVNGVLGLIVGPDVPEADEVVATTRAEGSPIIVLDEEPERQGKALASHAFRNLNRSTARVEVDEEDPFFVSLAYGFTSAWKNLGGTIEPSALDVVQLIARFSIAPNRLGKGPILVGSRGPAILTSREVYQATTYTATAKFPKTVRDWQQRFTKRFGQAPTGDAVLGHDALNVLLQALGELSDPTRKSLLAAVAGMKTFDGLTGTWHQYDGRWQRPLFLVRRQGEKGEVVETVPVPDR